MSEILETVFFRKFDKTKYDNYISSIRFPYFKNLALNTEILFDKPFTVFVGPNGAGKSSALQALYGCPQGYSVSEFWFSTELDPIIEGEDTRNRYIYKFKPPGYKKSVEVIQTRSLRAKTEKQDADPDYWETARPKTKDGMSKMPKFIEAHEELRTKTRWNPVVKKVVYIDFRSELSSYDKFFYFGVFNKGKRIKKKQDFIRSRSKILNRHIKNYKGKVQFWGKGIGRRTDSIYSLTEEELDWVNNILNKNYLSAKIIKHTLFNNAGYSIMFQDQINQYSEAAAGSGEVSVVNCVTRVIQSTNKSLILLDEPEVSLHPGAQIKLREFLLTFVRKHGHQVVMSTHSEHFVKELPDKAVKLFIPLSSKGRFNVINECSPEQAFIRLGIKSDNRRKIYVEDVLAVHLVEEALKEIDDEMLDRIHVIAYPGGADKILLDLLIQLSINNDNNDLILLDGDQNDHVEKNDEHSIIRAENISKAKEEFIDDILNEQIGISGKTFSLPKNGGNAPNSEQAVAMKLSILDCYHDSVKVMNVDTPEELIWKISSNKNEGFTDLRKIKSSYKVGDYKERFRGYTLSELGEEDTNSKTILSSQKAFLRKRNCDHSIWINFKNLLQEILSIKSI
tara:strand:+ start:112 stop:1974 length:1863 start_codon:yes stop_codon:yes gene_type:complete